MKDVLCRYIAVMAIALMTIPSIAMAQTYTPEYVPAGTQMLLRLETPISTELNRPGDQFTASIVSPWRFEGATVRGHISRIDPSGRFSGRTEMGLAFDTVEFTNGRVLPFNAELVAVRQSESVKMVDEDGNVISGSRGRQAIRRGGIGALAGGIIGGLIGGGKGFAIGLLAGGAAGAGSLYFEGAKELRLEPGAEMDVAIVTPSVRPLGPPQMSRYDRGLVMDIQRALRDEGYYTGAINGILEWRTRSALAQSQRNTTWVKTKTIAQTTANVLVFQ